MPWQRDTAEIVVNDLDLNTGFRFFLENFQYFVPEGAFVDDEEFHENIMLGFLQFFEIDTAPFLAAAEISAFGILKYREAAVHGITEYMGAFLLHRQNGFVRPQKSFHFLGCADRTVA